MFTNVRRRWGIFVRLILEVQDIPRVVFNLTADP